MRLGVKLFLGFFLIVGLAAFFVMRIFVNEVKPGVRQAIESTLVDTANLLAEIAAPELAAGDLTEGRFVQAVARAQRRDPQAMVWRFPKRSMDVRVTVTDAQGIVVYDSLGRDVGRDNSRWNDVYRTLRGEYGARSSPEVPGDTTQTVMHVAAPVMDPQAPQRIIGVLTVAQPNRSIDPFINAAQGQIMARGAWLIALSALIGVLMTWWLAHGIGRLNRYAQAVASDEPVPPPAPRGDEIGDLGRALERMRLKLQGKAYVEQYVQSLTHEMKSPLAAIRAAAELLQAPMPEQDRARFVHSIQAQEQRLTSTIDKLLALAEVEQHGWLRRRAAVSVQALLDTAVEHAALSATAQGVSLQVACEAGLQVQGDGFLLAQVLDNLLGNAIAFAPGGSVITVSAQRIDAGVRIQVRDHGPGIPDYAMERVFERFYSLSRPDGRPRSSGLGLPFVREVMRLHGGSAALDNHPDGGALATLELPVG